MSKKVIVHDRMQEWYEHELIEPMGENFDKAFRPDLTPKEMLALGVFGGVYLNDCQEEFPPDWFENAKLQSDDLLPDQDKKLNYYSVLASQSLAVW